LEEEFKKTSADSVKNIFLKICFKKIDWQITSWL
jgi:hypothetical protein